LLDLGVTDHIRVPLIYSLQSDERGPLPLLVLHCINTIPCEITGEAKVLDKTTHSFRMQFHEELGNLNQFKKALVETSRREAVDSLIISWSSELRAMGHVKSRIVSDSMLLVAAVDNRKEIEDLTRQLEHLRSAIENLKSKIEEMGVS